MEEGVKDEVSVPTETEATDVIVEEEEGSTEPESTTQAGDKTEPNLLLKSLQEERAKRRELEKLLEATKVEDNSVYSDEGRMLKQEINALNEKIALKEITESFPALKDKLAEFNEYKQDYQGVPMEKVAKLFLAENGLLEKIQVRKGLEKSSGGIKSQPQTGMSQEELADLRKNNGKKYYEMLKAGKIKF